MFLSNIIWNSIKYNIKNWEINIKYHKWILNIKDTWIWIEKKDLDKIFDRFFKTDSSRNSEWFWIWLSLVKKISDIYKWKIKVKSEEKKWTEFIIKIK
jgi:signal transduction histidine kinase